MVETGAEYAVVESTSHGLEQDRVLEVDYDVAAITNVTAEHLDYHKTFEAYLAAKARLFQMLATSYHKPGAPKVSVLNADDPSIDTLRPIPADRHLTYGIGGSADVRATDLALAPDGARFTAVTPDASFSVSLPLPGRYNVSNALCAIAVALSQEIPIEAIRRALAEFPGVPGRMDRIDRGQPFTVIVDFAHTPNSLDQALDAARAMTAGRVISVFGCAGLRDYLKRPVMGEVAGRKADLVVLTAEDPRTESLEAINAEVVKGLERAGKREGEGYFVVLDREEAIAVALRAARPGDVVMITGKGHEQSMCFGTTEYPWSDHAAVERQLREVRGVG
jgi:UDP-N-acetylmuramoyl-L-alanyl-D-glutamate--2,6-diaminopimelate ligase